MANRWFNTFLRRSTQKIFHANNLGPDHQWFLQNFGSTHSRYGLCVGPNMFLAETPIRIKCHHAQNNCKEPLHVIVFFCLLLLFLHVDIHQLHGSQIHRDTSLWEHRELGLRIRNGSTISEDSWLVPPPPMFQSGVWYRPQCISHSPHGHN